MNNSINVHDLKTNYSKYLDQVIQNQEELILSKYGKPVAKIVPLPPLKQRKLGTMKGEIVLPPDFNEPMMELWDID